MEIHALSPSDFFSLKRNHPFALLLSGFIVGDFVCEDSVLFVFPLRSCLYIIPKAQLTSSFSFVCTVN
jgi:hypothetical protein